MTFGNAEDQPWQGGVSVPIAPPQPPQFDSAAVVVAQQSDTETGVTISYSQGIFTRQFWSAGHPVPLLIEVLKPAEVKQVRDQVRAQLAEPGDGLDLLPLRAFLTVADVFLSPEPSGRYAEAMFGTITEPTSGQLVGTVTYPDGVTGTVSGTASGIDGESHLGPLPSGPRAPLRTGDLRSLAFHLEKALTAGDLDPLWPQLLTFVQQTAA